MIFDLRDKKIALRREIRAQALNLDPEYIKESDGAILRGIAGLPEFTAAGSVFCFVGTVLEINTLPLIRTMLKDGKRVAVPLCVSPGLMEARLIGGTEELAEGRFGISEPARGSVVLPASEIDLAIIPCVTCDSSGNRLGKGGGYYDRFLRADTRRYPAAAVCRRRLMRPSVPAEPFDCRADIVVTETKIFYCTSRVSNMS